MTDSRRKTSSPPHRRAIVVLGMHRAGTSALAGLLMKLGGDGPATPLGANRDNPQGHFESRALYLLQDELLASAGTSWDDYRPFSQSWLSSPKADEFRDRLQTLMQTEFGSSGFFVIKDPRNCRLVSFWVDVLARMQVAPLFVHTHRDPTEVALSLQRRNGLDPEYGCLLWLRHMLDAEAGSRGLPRSFTSYARLLQGWPAEVEKIGADLQITWPRYDTAQLSGLDQMIRPDLHRNSAAGLTGSRVFARWFRDTLEIFDRWAETGETMTDHATLDRIRGAFEGAAGVFGGTVHPKGKALASERDAALKAADEAQAAGTALQAERDAARKAAEEAKAQHIRAQAQGADLQAGLDAVTADRDRIAAQLTLSRNMLEQRKAEIDDTTRELDKTRAALTEAEAGRQALARELAQATDRIGTLQAGQVRRDRELVQVQQAILGYQDKMAAAEAGQRRDVAKLAETVQTLNDKLGRSEARVQALLSSNSWRVTAPIRWIMLRLKR